MQSLTDRDFGAAKWHTSNQLIPCQCESSFSHGKGLVEHLWTGVQSCSLLLTLFLHYCLCIWSHLIPSESTPPSLAHTPTHSLAIAFFCSFNTKEIVLSSGIYQGWNVFRERKRLWIWAYSTYFMRKYWIELNFHTGYIFSQEDWIIFLYNDPLSIDLNFLWISSKCSITE